VIDSQSIATGIGGENDVPTGRAASLTVFNQPLGPEGATQWGEGFYYQL